MRMRIIVALYSFCFLSSSVFALQHILVALPKRQIVAPPPNYYYYQQQHLQHMRQHHRQQRPSSESRKRARSGSQLSADVARGKRPIAHAPTSAPPSPGWATRVFSVLSHRAGACLLPWSPCGRLFGVCGDAMHHLGGGKLFRAATLPAFQKQLTEHGFEQHAVSPGGANLSPDAATTVHWYSASGLDRGMSLREFLYMCACNRNRRPSGRRASARLGHSGDCASGFGRARARSTAGSDSKGCHDGHDLQQDSEYSRRP